ncbi:restriction endonuclease subunit S [uncultured Alistipes sp.]|uniref:restriction endonuclease subunit S n=1 Tax=uncultured Alistipes sp. TaxID=538949 RepID=UPI002628EDCC|nr:restriction endonuclease subunit S [uncultured Alistipes sp.]
MENWKTYMALEFCLNVTDGTHDSPKPKSVGHYLITSKHLQNNTIDFSSAYRISEEDYLKIIKRSAVVQHDILFSMIGTIGNTVRVKEAEVDYAVKNMAIFKMGGNQLRSKWMYYWLKSNKAKKYIASRLAGSTQSYLTLDSLRKFPISAPSEDEMNKIVSLLSSLDDKIELNRRINDNLEQQAQALFKSWFLDNPNPNWREETLSEVALFIGGYSYNGEELTDSSNVAMATIKNFGRNGGFKVDGFKDITPSGKLRKCHYADTFDILVAHTDLTQNADVIGNAELLLTKGNYDSIIFSMDLVKVLPNDSFPHRFLLAAMLKNKVFKGHCLGYVNGTTVLHLSKKALPEFEIKIPSESEANVMNDTLASLYKRMAEVLQENDRLTRLRDTLLPKLMSGDLKINDLNC